MTRIVWMFSLVLGYSRLLWARFVLHQDLLQTGLRCHLAAFATLDGVPRQILYDRMKTAVSGEDAEGHIVARRSSPERPGRSRRNQTNPGRRAETTGCIF